LYRIVFTGGERLTNLESFSNGAQLGSVDFDLASSHVRWLFGVERIGDASHHEHVQLLASPSIFLLLLRPLRTLLRAAAAAAPTAVRRRERRARTCRTDAVGSGRMCSGCRTGRGTDAVEASGGNAADSESDHSSGQGCRTRSGRCQTDKQTSQLGNE